MFINFNDSNNFEIYVMDLLESYHEEIKSGEDLEEFSNELHQSIESAITEMLENDQIEGITPDDYCEQY